MHRGPSGAAWLLVLPLVVCHASWSSNGGAHGPPTPPPSLATLERQAHTEVNAYRVSKGRPALIWSNAIADQARRHSASMAAGATAFGHDGFDDRAAIIAKKVPWTSVGENVGMMTSKTDPATGIVNLWLDSPSHRGNIEGDFDMTGIGIARTSGGSLYLTQIFVRSK